MKKEERIIPIILAGGRGTRLWPTSRKSMPKQFCASGDGVSTFKSTLECIDGSSAFTQPIIVTNEGYLDIVRSQLNEISISPRAIICEPIAKNTGPAIAVATEFCRRYDEEKLLFLPSDHQILDTGAFLQSILGASNSASTVGRITAFGIVPTSPSKQYGYICAADSDQISEIRSISCFIEKPKKEDAEWLIQRKDVLWNSGVFLVDRKTALNDFCQHAPKLTAGVAMAAKKGTFSDPIFRPDSRWYARIENTQFDKAIMEKTQIASVALLRDGWLDLGNWQSVWENADKDEDQNFNKGNVYSHDSKNCLTITDGPAVGVVGLDNIVVVANQDAVLVTTKTAANGLKSIVDKMARNDDKIALYHTHETRPWGQFSSLKSGKNFQVKSIVVEPEGQLSLQYHHHRAEHWVVVKGQPTVTVGETVKQLSSGESVYIPCGDVHRLENLTDQKIEIIEVQIGDYLGEDDIVRVEDVYDRQKTPALALV